MHHLSFSTGCGPQPIGATRRPAFIVVSIDIVPFEASHYPAAHALWVSAPGVGLSEADERHALEQFLARNEGLSLVALEGASLVGTILVGHDGRRGLIHHLAVATRSQRQGIGSRLVREGMERLRGVGIQKCHLLVFAGNTTGRSFWSSVGAEHRDSLAIYSLRLA